MIYDVCIYHKGHCPVQNITGCTCVCVCGYMSTDIMRVCTYVHVQSVDFCSNVGDTLVLIGCEVWVHWLDNCK